MGLATPVQGQGARKFGWVPEPSTQKTRETSAPALLADRAVCGCSGWLAIPAWMEQRKYSHTHRPVSVTAYIRAVPSKSCMPNTVP